MVFSCCVSTCKNRNDKVHMHRFPVKDSLVCTQWLNRIANTKLLMMDKTQLHKNYMVCEEHFYEGCIVPNSKRRLKLGSLPIHNLPGEQVLSIEDAIIARFCKGSTLSMLKYDNFGASSSAAVTSNKGLPENDNPTVSTDIVSMNEENRSTTPVAGCSKLYVSTPKKRKDFQNRVDLLRLTNSTRAAELSPKAKKLYRVAKNLRKCNNSLLQENSALKKYLTSLPILLFILCGGQLHGLIYIYFFGLIQFMHTLFC